MKTTSDHNAVEKPDRDGTNCYNINDNSKMKKKL